MKKLTLSAIVALVSMTTMAPVAIAGSHYYDDDYSGYEQSYHYKKQRHCWWKKVKWYDEYGYVHWKRVKVCQH